MSGKELEKFASIEPGDHESPEVLASSLQEVVKKEKDPILEDIEKVKSEIRELKKGLAEIKELEAKYKTAELEDSDDTVVESSPMSLDQSRSFYLAAKEDFDLKEKEFEALAEKMGHVVDELKVNSPIHSISQLRENLALAKVSYKDGLRLRSQLASAKKNYSRAITVYKEKKLQSLGLKETENHWDLRNRKYGEIQKKAGWTGLGKIMNRKSIEVLEAEVKEVGEVGNLDPRVAEFYDLKLRSYSLWNYARCFTEKTSNVLKPVFENLASEIKESTPIVAESFSAEEVSQLEDEYFGSVIAPRAKKIDRRVPVDRIMECTRKALPFTDLLRSSSYNAGKENTDYQAFRNEFKDFLESYGYQITAALPVKSIEDTCAEFLKLVRGASTKTRRIELGECLDLCNDMFGPGFEISYADLIEDADYFGKDSFDETLEKLDENTFMFLRKSPIIAAKFKKVEIDQVRGVAQKVFIKDLYKMANAPHQSSDKIRSANLDLGQKVTKLGGYENALPIVLNAFRSMGNGRYPLSVQIFHQSQNLSCWHI